MNKEHTPARISDERIIEALQAIIKDRDKLIKELIARLAKEQAE